MLTNYPFFSTELAKCSRFEYCEFDRPNDRVITRFVNCQPRDNRSRFETLSWADRSRLFESREKSLIVENKKMKSEAKRETSFLLLVELARHPFPPFLHRIANVIITYGTWSS